MLDLRTNELPAEQHGRYDVVTARAFAEMINRNCPDNREKALVITKLEECIMWANASIARDHFSQERQEALYSGKQEIPPGVTLKDPKEAQSWY